MGIQYCHIKRDERAYIEVFCELGVSYADIGRLIGRHRSTVLREVRRGLMRLGHYLAAFGQRYYDEGRIRAGSLRRKFGHDLNSRPWRIVRQALNLGWSPEQIAGRLRSADPPPGPWIAYPLSVSHQTIYRAIYGLPPSIQRRDLVKLLRHSQGGRRKPRRGSQGFVGLLDTTPISERPAWIERRRQAGHWEGDLIEGGRGTSSVIITLVERVSRLVRLVKLPNAASLTMLHGVQRGLGAYPPTMRRTLTYDRGTEMAQHKELARSLGIKIFFCNAYSPWQRGTNENTNGLLRQYLPKGMDFASVSDRRLKRIEWLLNNRPRKTMGWRTPQEEFDRLLAKQRTR